MNIPSLLVSVVAAVLCHVLADETSTKSTKPTIHSTTTTPDRHPTTTAAQFPTATHQSTAGLEEAEWGDVVDCFKMLTNHTSLPVESQLPPADITRGLFKAICGTKDQFLSCVDSSLSRADDTSLVQLFRPLFNLTLVTAAYNDLCSNITVTESDEDLSCLINSTALVPCYNEYYNYLFYLSVVRRFGSPQRQLSNDVVNTLLCTLAEERRDCEVAALSVCSTKIGHVMQSFYQKTLPSACKEEDEKEADEKTSQ